MAEETTGLALSVSLAQVPAIVRSGRASTCTTVHQHEALIPHAAVAAGMAMRRAISVSVVGVHQRGLPLRLPRLSVRQYALAVSPGILSWTDSQCRPARRFQPFLMPDIACPVVSHVASLAHGGTDEAT